MDTYHRAARLRKLGLRADRLERMLRKAQGTCPFCSGHGRRLTPWRWSKTGQVSSLICWACRKRIMLLWPAVKGPSGVVWLGRVVLYATRSMHGLITAELAETNNFVPVSPSQPIYPVDSTGQTIDAGETSN